MVIVKTIAEKEDRQTERKWKILRKADCNNSDLLTDGFRYKNSK